MAWMFIPEELAEPWLNKPKECGRDVKCAEYMCWYRHQDRSDEDVGKNEELKHKSLS